MTAGPLPAWLGVARLTVPPVSARWGQPWPRVVDMRVAVLVGGPGDRRFAAFPAQRRPAHRAAGLHAA